MQATQQARAFVLRARCYVALQEYQKAEHDLADALSLFEPLASVKLFAGVQSGLANWWEVSAQLRLQQQDFPEAIAAQRKAVEYRHRVSQAFQLSGPYKYASLASALQKLGKNLHAGGDTEGAQQATLESRNIRAIIQQPGYAVSTDS